MPYSRVFKEHRYTRRVVCGEWDSVWYCIVEAMKNGNLISLGTSKGPLYWPVSVVGLRRILGGAVYREKHHNNNNNNNNNNIRWATCSSLQNDMKRLASTLSAPGASPPKFPKVHEYATDINRDDTIHRDNSPFLAELAKHKAVIFLRPMQLGKTSSLTLAEFVFSIKETAPTNLELQLPPEDKNSFFVLRIDFGNVSAATNVDWKFRPADFDKARSSKSPSNCREIHLGSRRSSFGWKMRRISPRVIYWTS
eukprot:scaffold18078_cov147-Amphora_coffeaeformis.AAC.3